ncbi:MAG: hypothetical protein QOD74_1695 [Variibacter sp.]|nr:hypothetical protein [Variibacter sp.]
MDVHAQRRREVDPFRNPTGVKPHIKRKNAPEALGFRGVFFLAGATLAEAAKQPNHENDRQRDADQPK